MPHSELLAVALDAARAAEDVVRHYYQRNLQDHDQGRQVAGHRGRRRDREGHPLADRGEVSGARLPRRGDRHLAPRRGVRLVRRSDRRYQGIRARVPDVLDADRADARGPAGGRRFRRADLRRAGVRRDRRRRVAQRATAAGQHDRHDRGRGAVDRQPEDPGHRAAVAGVRAAGRPARAGSAATAISCSTTCWRPAASTR